MPCPSVKSRNSLKKNWSPSLKLMGDLTVPSWVTESGHMIYLPFLAQKPQWGWPIYLQNLVAHLGGKGR